MMSVLDCDANCDYGAFQPPAERWVGGKTAHHPPEPPGPNTMGADWPRGCLSWRPCPDYLLLLSNRSKTQAAHYIGLFADTIQYIRDFRIEFEWCFGFDEVALF